MAEDKTNGFDLEEILAEQRESDRRKAEETAETDSPEFDAGSQDEFPQEQYPEQYDEEYEQAPESHTAQPEPQSGAEDLNRYATGGVDLPEDAPRQEYYEEELPEDKPKKKKGGFFGRKKKKKKRTPDFDESDDMYYGIQIKPIDEYRKGFNSATGELDIGADTYAALFDDSKKAIDDEVEKNFEQLRRERRSRVAEAVQSAGVDQSEIEEELGFVAPMPVSSFGADPYTRQHGVGVEGSKTDEELPEFQKAQLQSIEKKEQTMEIKLNVLNDTIELQRTREDSPVTEETVEKILEQAPPVPEEEFVEKEPVSLSEEPGEAVTEPAAAVRQETAVHHTPAEQPAEEEALQQTAVQQKQQPVSQSTLSDTIIEGRPVPQVPTVSSIYEYRARGIPTHIINADILQSALLSEAQEIEKTRQMEQAQIEKQQRRTKPRPVPQAVQDDEYENVRINTIEDMEQESIEDYTGPEDAKSISTELRGDMHDLTMRMMITGACTVILTLINLIFGGTFAAAEEIGSSPVIYIALTLVFLAAAIAVCFKTIVNGLKALFMFNANSDSGVAIAAVGVVVQTLSGLFFTDDIARGSLHLYAVILTAVLFANAAGKLTMIRRIHSNFRFITSREQKYAVQGYDDYNTALKMTKDVVAEKPLIAYQSRTGFLKRFLEFSYKADPAETASQMIAPIGLISSLVLCIACLLITSSVPAALSALSAALLACVAISNMLAVNLPVSRLTKRARRAGAMIVGYEGVEELGNTNAIMVDANELFPKGTVVLNGIKTYGDRMTVQDVVLAASALVNEVGGPLSGVFEQVITENEDALPEVESYKYEDGKGISGHVDGQRIYIGNRSLLINHRIDPPAQEDETQYSNGNRQVVYIAADKQVIAMMIITYSADRRRKNELQRLEENGVSVVVYTTDPNVTGPMVAKLFDIDSNSVTVLDDELGKVCKGLTEREAPRSDALVATKGRVESMMNVVSLCVSSKRQINLIVALQTGAVILGFLLVAFMACFSAINQLSSFTLFVFELVCMLLIIFIPKIRRS